jgi:hypothetical protein
VLNSPRERNARDVLLGTITVSRTEGGDVSRPLTIRGKKMYVNVIADGEADSLDKPVKELNGKSRRDVVQRLLTLKDSELEL